MDDKTLEKIKRIYDQSDNHGREIIEKEFPELSKNDDELRRQHIIQKLEYLRSLDANNQYGKENINKDIAWLEKQKSVESSQDDTPSKYFIHNVWELGNLWEDITKGSSNTEHRTQLEYILKHWKEGYYYTKINQKLTWNEGDEEMLNAIMEYEKVHQRLLPAEINWIKSLVNRIKGE